MRGEFPGYSIPELPPPTLLQHRVRLRVSVRVRVRVRVRETYLGDPNLPRQPARVAGAVVIARLQ